MYILYPLLSDATPAMSKLQLVMKKKTQKFSKSERTKRHKVEWQFH